MAFALIIRTKSRLNWGTTKLWPRLKQLQNVKISTCTTRFRTHSLLNRKNILEILKFQFSLEGLNHITWMMDKELLDPDIVDNFNYKLMIKAFMALKGGFGKLKEEELEELWKICNEYFKIKDFRDPALKDYNFQEFCQGAGVACTHFLRSLKSAADVDSLQSLLYPDLFQEAKEYYRETTVDQEEHWKKNRLIDLKFNIFHDMMGFDAIGNSTDDNWPKICDGPKVNLTRASAFKLHPLDFDSMNVDTTLDGVYGVIDVGCTFGWESEALKKQGKKYICVRFGGWLSENNPDWKIMDVAPTVVLTQKPFFICCSKSD